MRLLIAAALFSAGLGIGSLGIGSLGIGSFGIGMNAARAADACGPGCHSAINGGCVVDGWEAGLPVRNECPAGARPYPPCYRPHVWRRHAKACMNVN